jgi:glycosyltransferase involved in cell wall biosynthesis
MVSPILRSRRSLAPLSPPPILVIVRTTLPKGGAATSRVRSFARGLQLAGASVEVLACASEDVSPDRQTAWKPKALSGWEGIPCHLVGTLPNDYPGGPLARRWNQFRHVNGINRALRARLTELLARRRPAAVLNYTQQSSVALPLFLRCRRAGVPFFQQFAERHSHLHFRQGRASPFFWDEEAALLWAPSSCTGVVAVSTYLETLCRGRGARNVLRVPALTSTEPEPVSTAFPPAALPLRLGYLGNGDRRDLLPLMLAATALARARGLDLRLRIVGLSEGRQRATRRTAGELGVGDDVSVEGPAGRAEVARFLAESHCMFMLRERTDEGRAAFPTRLPEFLLAGRPVIASAVGDLELHLADRKEIVYVRSEAASEIAGAIEWVYRDRARLEAMGSAARLAGRSQFDYRRWGTLLCDFIHRHAGAS